MLFDSFRLGPLDLRNRAVMPPMCSYGSINDGIAMPFHMQHYLSRAIGGAGLIIQEATGIEFNGLITPSDLGLWNDEQVKALKPIVKEVQRAGAKILIQLSHAGRKSEIPQERPLAPSAIRFNDRYAPPIAMTKDDIKEFRIKFVEAVKRALEIGYDGVEIHGAHGYLISTFLSPSANKRTDEYGGNTENRRRFLKELLEDIRSFYPKDKALGLRVSAYDYVDGGMDAKEMKEVLAPLTSLLDYVHVSSGGVTGEQKIKDYPLYQVPFASFLKEHLNIPIIAVGRITTTREAEYILESGRADLVAFGRILLRDPFFLARENWDLIKDYPPYIRGVKE